MSGRRGVLLGGTLALFSAMGAGALSACGATDAVGGGGCTLLACQDGLAVELQAVAWPAATYVFDLSGDGKTLRCEGKLPLPACEQPGLACTGDLAAQVTVSGCALPAGQQGFGPIAFPSGPANVAVTITRDGALVANGTFQPTYATTRPNGPRCEPECRQASDRLAVGP